MRSAYGFLLIGSLIGTGCTGSLWGPFVQDNDTSCNVMPCTSGVCNSTTGLCEGGNPDGGGSPDGGITPLSFGSEVLAYRTDTQYYYFAIADLLNGNEPEIFMTGGFDAGKNKTNAVVLSSTDGYKTNAKEQIYSNLENGYLVTWVTPYSYSPDRAQDVIVAAANVLSTSSPGRIYYLGKGGGNTTQQLSANDSLPGYQVATVGYLDNDQNPDVLVTSSKLAIIEKVYPANGANGSALPFLGPPIATRGSLTKGTTWARNDLILAAPLSKYPSVNFDTLGFNVALTSPTVNSIDVVQKQMVSSKQTIDVRMPADFALLADMDQDGLYDVVTAKTAESIMMLGTLNVNYNTGTNQTPIFDTKYLTKSGVDALSAIIVDDIDKDNYPDIGVVLYVGNAVQVFHNEANPTSPSSRVYTLSATITSTVGARAMAFMDMNEN